MRLSFGGTRRIISRSLKNHTLSWVVGAPSALSEAEKREVASRDLFDPVYYVAHSRPNVSLDDAFADFLQYGIANELDPSPRFSNGYYRSLHPDLVQDVPAFLHYMRSNDAACLPGAPPDGGLSVEEIRLVEKTAIFDEGFYRSQYKDVAAVPMSPWQHYILFGWAEQRWPSARFDPSSFVAPSGDRSGLKEFLWRLEAMPRVVETGIFDEAYYVAHSPNWRTSGLSPIVHYLALGQWAFEQPSAAFDPVKYIVAAGDDGAKRIDALHHHLSSRRELEDGPAVADPTGEDASWLLVHRQRMRGVAFFSRFGFRFDDTKYRSFASEAVHELAGRRCAIRAGPGLPDVSIVIPVFGQLPFVLSCLDSLSTHESRFTAEILVVDDCSPTEEQIGLLSLVPWVTYVRTEQNDGFIESCNAGSRVAVGRYILLLNSDVRVVDGWLDGLIGELERDATIGLVGSKLLNPDGSLQEAGGIVWKDGSCWNYGRGSNPNHPMFMFPRDADYCSAASVALPLHFWQQLGGFDPLFKPAYYEDVDLAFRIRAAGRRVRYQPSSAVLHYEGRSHGTDVKVGLKAHQVRNARRFAEKWKGELGRHAENGRDPHREANRVPQTILIIDADTPRPDRDAGSQLTRSIIGVFQDLGFHVIFVPLGNFAHRGSYTAELLAAGVECHFAPHSSSLEEVIGLHTSVDVVLAFRVDVLAPILSKLRNAYPKARIIFHNVDLHFLRERREAELRNDTNKLVESSLTETRELSLIAATDCTIVTTAAEKQIVESEIAVSNVLEFPLISDLTPGSATYDERADIMFLGGFGHPPNIDACEYFCAAIWPLLVPRLPDRSRFLIVGSSPTAAIERLADDRIEVTGHVRTLAPSFEKARVFVAPLRFGAGIKGKVIASLSHGVPAVVTSVAAEGMGLVHGTHVLIADTAEDFAAAVVRLYGDEALWSRLQSNGYEFVRDRYSRAKATEKCKEALSIAAETWLRRQAIHRRRTLNDMLQAIEAEGAFASGAG